jgi:hypothetical protein
MQEAHETPAGSSRRPLALLAAVGLHVIAIFLAYVGSRIHGDYGATTYRLLRSVPGLVDICGDYTWAARAVPPALALAGGVVSVRSQMRARFRVVLAAIGLLLVVGLIVAVTQNAIPWGVRDCIVD